jgi:serine phosphatase RsbU (regulator of sigma subunit)
MTIDKNKDLMEHVSKLEQENRKLKEMIQSAENINADRLKAVIAVSRSGVILVNENNVVKFINTSLSKIFNIRSSQFVGMDFKTIAALIHDYFQNPEKFDDALNKVREDPAAGIEAELRTAIPKKGMLRFYSRPIRDYTRKHVGRVWIFDDISDIVRLNEVLKRYSNSLEDTVKERTFELKSRNFELEETKKVLEKKKSATELELEMGRQVQNALMPRKLQVPKGLGLAVKFYPAEKLSGDFYDVKMIDQDTIFILVADVAGHGVPAAMVATMAKMSLDRHFHLVHDMGVMLEKINRNLCELIKTNHYLTVVSVRYTISTGHLAYCRVCHTYPLHMKNVKDVRYITDRCVFFLGMFEESKFQERELELDVGDKFLIYTDGLTETFDEYKNQFGRDRVSEAALEARKLHGAEFLNFIFAKRNKFSGSSQTHDDITLFLMERTAS